MRCGECGKAQYQRVRGNLWWEDTFTGRLLVSDVERDECPNCGGQLFAPAACRRIVEACDKKRRDWLENRPIKDFWDGQQVTEFLGITRQALSKGYRYRRLLYRLERNGKYDYLADSVRLLKRTGDGRIPLEATAETEMPKRDVDSAWDTPPPATPERFVYPTADEAATPVLQLREKEATYA